MKSQNEEKDTKAEEIFEETVSRIFHWECLETLYLKNKKHN